MLSAVTAGSAKHDEAEHVTHHPNHTPVPGPMFVMVRLDPEASHLKLSQHGILWILIDTWLVGDVLGPVGIAQR